MTAKEARQKLLEQYAKLGVWKFFPLIDKAIIQQKNFIVVSKYDVTAEELSILKHDYGYQIEPNWGDDAGPNENNSVYSYTISW